MNVSKSSQPVKQTMLTADGELREADAVSAQPRPAVYCIYCGTPNRAEGNFCRQCGQSLDDQTLQDHTPLRYGAGGKSKQVMSAPAAQNRTFLVLVFEVIKLAMIGGLVYFVASPFTNFFQIALAGFIVLAWIIIEGFQHGAISDSNKDSNRLDGEGVSTAHKGRKKL